MDGTTNGLSAADLALLNNNGFGEAGGGSWIWIFALFLLFFGFGNNGFNNQNNPAVAASGGFVTNSQMNDAFNFASLERQNNDIIATVNQSKYDNINVIKDVQSALQTQLAGIAGMEQAIIEKQQSCCCQLQRDISESTAAISAGLANIGYQDALNTAAINQNTTAQTQKILDAIAGNRMADMQNQINQLQLTNAMAGVVRYPMSAAYYVNPMPFNGFPYPPVAPTGI